MEGESAERALSIDLLLFWGRGFNYLHIEKLVNPLWMGAIQHYIRYNIFVGTTCSASRPSCGRLLSRLLASHLIVCISFLRLILQRLFQISTCPIPKHASIDCVLLLN